MGNTESVLGAGRVVEDHPHIHGEYDTKMANGSLPEGSPPHTWGIPEGGMRGAIREGITPTYMGNTL